MFTSVIFEAVSIKRPLAGPPFRLGDAWQAQPAPRLGEHTSEVLGELGYSADEQIALFRAGVTA